MNNETVTEVAEAPAPTTGQAKALDFNKIDALKKHMLLTTDALCVLLGCSRVSYYGWLLHGVKPRPKMAERIRKVVRELVTAVSQHNWPSPKVFVASPAERLILLQELLKEIDKSTEQQ